MVSPASPAWLSPRRARLRLGAGRALASPLLQGAPRRVGEETGMCPDGSKESVTESCLRGVARAPTQQRGQDTHVQGAQP